MPEYTYQATNPEGSTVMNELVAEDLATALEQLKNQGLTVLSIRPKDVPFSPLPLAPESSHHRLWLEAHFESALQRREVLIPALTALVDDLPAGRHRDEMRCVVTAFKAAKSSEDLLHSEALLQWLPLLVFGLSSETTTQQLGDLIAQASREDENRRQRRRLLAYPLVVALLAFVVVAFLSVIVVPIFSSMFDEFGISQRGPTRWVIFISDQLRLHPWQSLGSVTLICIAAYAVGRVWIRLTLTTQLFGFFTLGNSGNVSAISSLTGILAELLDMGLSLSDSLWIAGQGCRHHYYRRVTQQLAKDAHCGQVANSRVAKKLPANVLVAIQGVDGKPNVPLLRELSALYGDRVWERIDCSTSVFAQFAVVAVGLAVGFVVIALFSPIIGLVSNLS